MEQKMERISTCLLTSSGLKVNSSKAELCLFYQNDTLNEFERLSPYLLGQIGYILVILQFSTKGHFKHNTPKQHSHTNTIRASHQNIMGLLSNHGAGIKVLVKGSQCLLA